eukprot:125451_1
MSNHRRGSRHRNCSKHSKGTSRQRSKSHDYRRNRQRDNNIKNVHKNNSNKYQRSSINRTTHYKECNKYIPVGNSVCCHNEYNMNVHHHNQMYIRQIGDTQVKMIEKRQRAQIRTGKVNIDLEHYYPDKTRYVIFQKPYILSLVNDLQSEKSRRMKPILNDLLNGNGKFNVIKYPFEYVYGNPSKISMRAFTIPTVKNQSDSFYPSPSSNKILQCFYDKNANTLIYDMTKIIPVTWIWQIKIFHNFKSKKRSKPLRIYHNSSGQKLDILIGSHKLIPALQPNRDCIIMTNKTLKYLFCNDKKLNGSASCLLQINPDEVLVSSYTDCFRSIVKDNGIMKSSDGSNIITIFGMKMPFIEQTKIINKIKSQYNLSAD